MYEMKWCGFCGGRIYHLYERADNLDFCCRECLEEYYIKKFLEEQKLV